MAVHLSTTLEETERVDQTTMGHMLGPNSSTHLRGNYTQTSHLEMGRFKMEQFEIPSLPYVELIDLMN